MHNIRKLDPTASPLGYFGFELRRYRESAGMPQGDLGDCIFCTGSLVGRIETAHKVPTREFAGRADAALLTDTEVGTLTLSPEAYVAFVGHVGGVGA